MVSNGIAQTRNNPFSRNASVSPAPSTMGRPKSVAFSASPLSGMTTSPSSHARTQSHTSLGGTLVQAGSVPRHTRDKSREGTPTSNTFAPSFIKSDYSLLSMDAVNGIECEIDFSGKRFVWLKDPQTAGGRGGGGGGGGGN